MHAHFVCMLLGPWAKGHQAKAYQMITGCNKVPMQNTGNHKPNTLAKGTLLPDLNKQTAAHVQQGVSDNLTREHLALPLH